MSRSSVWNPARARVQVAITLSWLSLVTFTACGSDSSVAPEGEDGGAAEEWLYAPGDTSDEPTADALDAGILNLDAPGDSVDAAVRENDGGALAPGEACRGTNPCDCDNDGYEGAGEGCSGEDCDDRDPLRFPKQTFVAVSPEDGQDGDWDCSGFVERQYATNLTCGLLGLLLCTSGAQGFIGNPKCGEEAPYYECKSALGLLCAPLEIGTRRQGCR